MNKHDDSGRKSAFFVPLPLVLCCAQSVCSVSGGVASGKSGKSQCVLLLAIYLAISFAFLIQTTANSVLVPVAKHLSSLRSIGLTVQEICD